MSRASAVPPTCVVKITMPPLPCRSVAYRPWKLCRVLRQQEDQALPSKGLRWVSPWFSTVCIPSCAIMGWAKFLAKV
eukprot:5912225-Amphidinium_carterae.1